MHLPIEIRDWVDETAAGIPRAALERAASTLSAHYRDQQPTRRAPLAAPEMVAAYLVTRLPATYAAVHSVLEEVKTRIAEPVHSLLDLGAGCGTATLAAREVLADLTRCALMESNPAMIAAASNILSGVTWLRTDLRHAALPPAELVIASYSLGELSEADREKAADRAWAATGRVLVLIEPGSPAGFATIRSLRDRLLAAGAFMIAPCPHQGPCPIPSGDWCHFAARVERSALHRQLKHATLSYADEKFSYVALSKTAVKPAPARIIRRPVYQPGLIELTVCHGDHIAQKAVRKRDKETFRAARHAAWGSAWSAETVTK